ncbi:DEAD-box ATP-dependent RNA helicase CshA OS=Lysinibacillus sphaericus OX=1421 GN=cshA PE=3 SV=1 [Lysinibacillus sphaericus]
MIPLRPPTYDEALVGQQSLAIETLEGIIANNNLGDYRTLGAEVLRT